MPFALMKSLLLSLVPSRLISFSSGFTFPDFLVLSVSPSCSRLTPKPLSFKDSSRPFQSLYPLPFVKTPALPLVFFSFAVISLPPDPLLSCFSVFSSSSSRHLLILSPLLPETLSAFFSFLRLLLPLPFISSSQPSKPSPQW